jgi:hypothetical protein
MHKALALLLLFMAAGCAFKQYHPVHGEHTIENRFAIIRTDSLTIAVRPQPYQGSYKSANNNFFPVYLRIRNTSGVKQHLSPQAVMVLSGGKQYDHIPLDYLLSTVTSRILLDDYQSPFSTDTTIQQLNREKQEEQYYELLAAYFSFGDLLPGGMKEGYLFYDRAVGSSKTIMIDVLGQEAVFVKE